VYLFNTVSTYFFSYRAALISASQRHYIVLSVNYIITIIQSCIQIPALILTKEYLPYLFIQTVGTLINNIALSILAKKDYPYIDRKNIEPLSREEKRSLFVNIKALTVNRLCASLVNNTDNIVITYFNGLITTGLTSNYSLLVNTLGTLAGQFFNSITASVGNLNASESKEKQRNFFDVLNLLNFWIYGWGAIGIAFVSGEIVRICFGEGYVLDMKIPIVIALNFYLVGMNNAVWAYKNTMGLFRYGQYLLLVTAGINLWLDIVLGKQFGLLGIYMATIIARLLTNVWYDPYAVFKYGLETDVLQYYKKFIKYAFVLGIAGGLSYKFTMMCNFSGVLNVLMKFFICTVIPNIIFVFAFARTDEFRYLRRILFDLSSKVQKRICHK
ncbi:MAG: hypothetical protein Q4F24_13680, partial [Eubacteriales bacterium]|nr:hypothetical protein [Eubacteriales bacterium]